MSSHGIFVLCNLVKSLFGGTNQFNGKLYSNCIGEVEYSRDSTSSLLPLLPLLPPLPSLLVLTSKSFKERLGDGSLSLLLLVEGLLREGLFLKQNYNINVNKIIVYYLRIKTHLTTYLSTISTPFSSNSLEKTKQLLQLAKTIISTKLKNNRKNDIELISKTIVKTAKYLTNKDLLSNEHDELDDIRDKVNFIYLTKDNLLSDISISFIGNSLYFQSSRSFFSFYDRTSPILNVEITPQNYNKIFSGYSIKCSLKGPRICLISGPFSAISLSNDSEVKLMKQQIDWIINSKINLLISSKEIKIQILQLLIKHNIYVIQPISQEELNKISNFIQSDILYLIPSSLTDSSQNIELNNDNNLYRQYFGSTKWCVELNNQSSFLLIFSNLENSFDFDDNEENFEMEQKNDIYYKYCSIVIRGAWDRDIKQIQKVISDTLIALLVTLNHGFIVPSGASVEIEFVNEIKRLAPKLSSEGQMIASSFSKALLHISHILLANSSVDPLCSISLLANTHNQSISSCNHLMYGINITSGEIENMLEKGIIDSSIVKCEMIQQATELASMLLQSM